MIFLLLSATDLSENHRSYSEIPTLPLQELLDQIAQQSEFNDATNNQVVPIDMTTEENFHNAHKTQLCRKSIRFSGAEKLPEEGMLVVDDNQAILQTNFVEALTPCSSMPSSPVSQPESILENLAQGEIMPCENLNITTDNNNGDDGTEYDLLVGTIEVAQKKRWFFQWFKRKKHTGQRHSYSAENETIYPDLQTQRRLSAPAQLGSQARKSLRRFSQNLLDALNSSPRLRLTRQSMDVSKLFRNAHDSLEAWHPDIADAYKQFGSHTCHLSKIYSADSSQNIPNFQPAPDPDLAPANMGIFSSLMGFFATSSAKALPTQTEQSPTQAYVINNTTQEESPEIPAGASSIDEESPL